MSTTLKCDLKIIRAKNLEFVPGGDVFVRYFLCTGAGAGKRIRLNTREIPLMDEPCWNERASLQCQSSTDTLKELKQQSVVFELRWRSATPVIGRMVGSKLLGRAEVAWSDVLGSTNASMEKWVTLTTKSGAVLGLKQPALQLGFRVEIVEDVERMHTRRCRSMKWDDCGCRHGDCNARDEEIFSTAAALVLI
ncbi:hypothetical protein ACLOJK_013297 [Asimina triloba]